MSRDASKSCQTLNGGINVDFAHSGPNFLVWHRTYLLILERALQRVLDNTSFGLPYWKWEDNDLSVFDKRYFGKLSSTHGIIQDIEGGLNWNTVCNITYRQKTVDNTIAYWENDNSSYCMAFWVPCNPNADLRYGNRLQRGNAETYLPNVREIEIAIAAPEYDKSNAEGKYRQDSPRDSFRSRLAHEYICWSGLSWTMHHLKYTRSRINTSGAEEGGGRTNIICFLSKCIAHSFKQLFR